MQVWCFALTRLAEPKRSTTVCGTGRHVSIRTIRTYRTWLAFLLAVHLEGGYSMSRNGASGPEGGLPDRIVAGLLPGKNRKLPEGRFRCFPGGSPAKIRPGKPISGPEALLRNIGYPEIVDVLPLPGQTWPRRPWN